METNNNYNIVVDYIVDEFSFDRDLLNSATSLSEIGLDGDDVLDFLLKFFKKFEIDFEQSNYKDFIPTESGFLINTFFSLFGKREKIFNDEIRIKDLVESLDKKSWHKIPGTSDSSEFVK